MIEKGKKASAFSLPDQDGVKRSLKEFSGKKVALFFYPKANTGGWTTEATEFRDAYKKFADKNCVIIGISRDKPSAQKKWAEKYDLPFPLLSDPDGAVHRKYGAWGEKNMYGKKTMGPIRSTFLIDQTGEVIKVYPKVKAQGHAVTVLEDI